MVISYATTVLATSTSTSTSTNGPGDGKVFYDKGSHSNGWRFLEAYCGTGYGVAQGWAWCGSAYTSKTVGGTSADIGTGKENCDAEIAACGTDDYLIYYIAKTFTDSSYADWFLPSQGSWP